MDTQSASPKQSRFIPYSKMTLLRVWLPDLGADGHPGFGSAPVTDLCDVEQSRAPPVSELSRRPCRQDDGALQFGGLGVARGSSSYRSPHNHSHYVRRRISRAD